MKKLSYSCPGGQPIAMGSKEIVDRRPYLIEIEFGGLVRIRHRRMVDVLAPARSPVLKGNGASQH
jgi:hypothetical protein